MLNTVRAVVRAGRIELLESMDLPEGASALVTLLLKEDVPFWSEVSDAALRGIWDNTEDDVYARLLQA